MAKTTRVTTTKTTRVMVAVMTGQEKNCWGLNPPCVFRTVPAAGDNRPPLTVQRSAGVLRWLCTCPALCRSRQCHTDRRGRGLAALSSLRPSRLVRLWTAPYGSRPIGVRPARWRGWRRQSAVVRLARGCSSSPLETYSRFGPWRRAENSRAPWSANLRARYSWLAACQRLLHRGPRPPRCDPDAYAVS